MNPPFFASVLPITRSSKASFQLAGQRQIGDGYASRANREVARTHGAIPVIPHKSNEILQPGGSIEYNNDEAGAVWMRRMLDVYPKAVWLNPEPEQLWPYRQSISILREIMEARMYPITIEGLERAMRYLSK